MALVLDSGKSRQLDLCDVVRDWNAEKRAELNASLRVRIGVQVLPDDLMDLIDAVVLGAKSEGMLLAMLR